MKSVTTSIQVFGIYMILIPGIGLITVPAIMLDLFKLSHGNDMWMFRMISFSSELLLGEL